MSDAGTRWAESMQVRHPQALRWYRIVVAVGASAWFAWPVAQVLDTGRGGGRWAVLAGLVSSGGCIALVWFAYRLSPRAARWGLGAYFVVIALVARMLFDDAVTSRAFAGAFMLCFVGAVVVARSTGSPLGIAAGLRGRPKPTGRDAYLKRQERAQRSFAVTGRPPPITAFPIGRADQLALVRLADDLRLSRRRFRPRPASHPRLLFAGNDAVGKAQLAVSIAARAGCPLLRSDWTKWDPEGDGRTAFTQLLAEARKRRSGVVVMDGCGRLTSEEASWLASALDAADWPVLLLFTVPEATQLDWAIRSRLELTIRLDVPAT